MTAKLTKRTTITEEFAETPDALAGIYGVSDDENEDLEVDDETLTEPSATSPRTTSRRMTSTRNVRVARRSVAAVGEARWRPPRRSAPPLRLREAPARCLSTLVGENGRARVALRVQRRHQKKPRDVWPTGCVSFWSRCRCDRSVCASANATSANRITINARSGGRRRVVECVDRHPETGSDLADGSYGRIQVGGLQPLQKRRVKLGAMCQLFL